MLVVDATQGVEAQTVANAMMAMNANLEIIPLINKIDLPSADPERVRAEIEDALAIPADDAVLASLEYAVDSLHVSLLIVMGHEGCGAIDLATHELDSMIDAATTDPASSLEAADAMDDLDERIAESESIILRSVGMSIWQAREAEVDDPADIERVHVAHTIEDLVSRSEVIQNALAHDRLMIVGARYQLSNGKVEVLSF